MLPEFRRDLAVHHLKDDSLVWWEGVVESAHGIRLTWDDFLEAFNGKYFPLEAMHKMESKFQDIRQGSRNVREYGDEFNRLRRFAGHYLGDREQVRQFLKRMKIELRNSCNVRDYQDVHELIEKAAEQEAGLEEERRQNQLKQYRPRVHEGDEGGSIRESAGWECVTTADDPVISQGIARTGDRDDRELA